MTRLRCSNCGTENETSTSPGYCFHCGRDFPRDSGDVGIQEQVSPPPTLSDEGIIANPANSTAITPQVASEPKAHESVLEAKEKGTSAQELQALETIARKEISLSLFVVVFFQAGLGIWLLVMGLGKPEVVAATITYTLLHVVVFGMFAWWARKQPVQPAIWGLALYLLFPIASVLIAPALVFEVNCFLWWVKLAVLLMLVRSFRIAWNLHDLHEALRERTERLIE